MDNVWKNKDNNRLIAIKHTAEMESKYKDDIQKCINESVIYGISRFPDNKNKSKEVKQKIIIDDMDSVSAAYKYLDGKTCVLNFASYKNPGGLFLSGSNAQEEFLCHKSFLYSVLNSFDTTYYENNRNNKNKGLYLDRAIYSPNILFNLNNVDQNLDVLTCAAPNFGTAQQYCRVTAKENEECLVNRIRFILDICAEQEVKTLILGAWGCGVFRQSPQVVAKLFKECLQEYSCFTNIIFAIPNSNNNYKMFKEIFD